MSPQQPSQLALPEAYHSLRLGCALQPNTTLSSQFTPMKSSMDQIPIELLQMIVQELEDFGPYPDASSLLSGRISSSLTADECLMNKRCGLINWSKLTEESRRDILNCRQVATCFRDAAWPSFGKVIGDLLFRITKKDMKDLTEISKVEKLGPWLRSLTFGTRIFAKPIGFMRDGLDTVIDDEDMDDDDFWELAYNGDPEPDPHVYSGDLEPERWRDIISFQEFLRRSTEMLQREFMILVDAYREQYQAEVTLFESGSASSGLCEIFQALPQLTDLRIVQADSYGYRPMHIKGFLRVGQKWFFDRCIRDWLDQQSGKFRPYPGEYSEDDSGDDFGDCAIPSAENPEAWMDEYEYRAERSLRFFYRNCPEVVLPILFQALTASNKILNDLRIGLENYDYLKPEPSLSVPKTFDKLHTLRIRIDLPGVEPTTGTYFHLMLHVLRTSRCIRDFHLDIYDRLPIGFVVGTPFNDDLDRVSPNTTAIIRALRNVKGPLTRLSLIGSGGQRWRVPANDLISIFEAHSRTLKCITLQSLYVSTQWNPVLHNIVSENYAKLQYLGIDDLSYGQKIVWNPRKDVDRALLDGSSFEVVDSEGVINNSRCVS
ncbi:hypothetical protein BU16DRAFT_69214 [Lophium mytilinum]|uniref:Uncharacterized protein n=1 Tax=Lophium mytilinum TaxID=390894 RepID=A0A6A6QQ36_9PEZI|nr:hypothetical protein BU16DRAFT_69214 [Lophium mytilinum]